MKTTQAISALSALAHDGRLAAFRHLVKAGPGGLPAGDLARLLKMPASSLSTNLTLLGQAGLLSSKREGRSIIYRADFRTMQRLLSFLIEDCCGGASEVCSPLKGVLAACSPQAAR